MKKSTCIILSVIVSVCALGSLISLGISIWRANQAGESFPGISLLMTLVTLLCAIMVWRSTAKMEK